MKQILLVFLAILLTGVVTAQHSVSAKQTVADEFELPKRNFTRKVPRVLDNVPQAHYPRPGECRIWYPDRTNGEQPLPADCEVLEGIMLQEGAFILHNGKAYDTEYDWKKDKNKEREKEKSGKIPAPVLNILFGPNQSI